MGAHLGFPLLRPRESKGLGLEFGLGLCHSALELRFPPLWNATIR